MPRIRLWLAALVGALAPLTCAAAPLEAYGRLPTIETAALSPDGALVAVVLTDGDKRTVAVVNAADDKPVAALRAGDAKVRALQWAGPRHLLITSSVTGVPDGVIAPRSEWDVVVDYDLKADSQHVLLRDAADVITAVASTPSIRILGGKPYAFVEAVHFTDGEGRIALYKIDLDANRSTLLMPGWSNTEDWLVDAAGEPLAETEFDAKAAHWQLKVKRGADWRVAKAFESSMDYGGLMGLGRDGRSILIADTRENTDALRELTPEADDWGPRFAEQDDQDLIFDPLTERLIGVHALVGEADRYSFFAPADQAIWNATARAYAGSRVTLTDLSADHRKLIVFVDSPTDGPAYAFVDIDTGHAHFIGAAYDGLKPQDVSPVQTIAFKARDGLALSGYLTTPRGRDAKQLPLIVYPHGGPAARDEPGFDWWAQAMAAQGYAVLQVNYRGSQGFGWDFQSAGFGEWGKTMQTDLSDGVRYLAAQGTIDPARVCIVGASYGGYAALAGATLDTGVYRCAVDVSGPSEMTKFVAWAKDQSDISTQRYWTRYMGADGLKDPHLEAISPADHADKATVPILIIHGKDDTVVPFEQSQMMADALTKAGHPPQLVILKHEDHWLSHGDTRLQMLQAVMDFLKRNNPAD
jgi:dipeptidyl aminopeptidase/acylaminoacyl peptidase